MNGSRVLDHIAIHVRDREAATAELVDTFDMHVIEQTERFTLIGADFDHGKITLLDTEGGATPVARQIVSIVLAENADATISPPVRLESGLVVTFAHVGALSAEWADAPRHSLVGINLRCADPVVAAAHLEQQHGMRVTSVRPDLAVLDVDGHGAGRITLSRERWEGDDQGAPNMLDHLGVRVESAADWRSRAMQSDAEIVKWVDAAHSKAVFVAGPEELLIEFVEHTAPIEA